jgi:hypothetical protein
MAINSIEPSPVDNERNLLYKLLRGFYSGTFGSSGGGGAVTIADGADVALGAKADAPATNTALPGTIMGWLKGISFLIQSGAFTVIQPNAPQLNATVVQGNGANLNATVVQGNSANLNATVVQGMAANLNATVVQGTAASLNATVVGNVGGYTTVIKDTTVVTAAAYSAGNAVGAKRTIANAVRTPGTGILESVTILDRANQKAGMTLFIFDADPTNATITDKSAFVFSTDDLKVIAQVSFAASDYVTTNSKAIAQKTGLAIALKAASGTTLYAALVTTGTPTFAATTDVQLEYGILQD